MERHGYNLVIPNTVIPNFGLTRVSRVMSRCIAPGPFMSRLHWIRPRFVARLSFVMLGMAMAAGAVTADWNGPEQQLARKIAAVTGPASVVLTVENRSSLGKRDSEIIQNGLRSALEGVGVRIANSGPSVGTLKISLSENLTSYVWVAEIRQGTGGAVVAMVSLPRPESSGAVGEPVPLSLRKIPLWSQDNLFLDVAVLEESSTPTRIAVLEPEKVALYRWQSGKWQPEQELSIAHAQPWPRDLRGRLMTGGDHLLDVYLPGVICRSAGGVALSLSCRESDDPWPLVPAALKGRTFSVVTEAGSTTMTIPQVEAFYAATRNFFTGALTSTAGKVMTAPKFYSAAFLPRDQSLLWVFAGVDGRVHRIEGVKDETVKIDWGSDLASVKTACGAGWQVLAASPEEGGGDSVRAYEFPARDPAAVSATVDFDGDGMITALWTEAKGETAIAIVSNRETGRYEAFRLAVSCSQ